MNIEKKDLFKRYYAQQIFVAAVQKLPPAVWIPALDRMEFDVFESLAQEMAFSITTHIAGIEKERIMVDLRWPADWWQAFRERWFPRWWLARWPVKYNEYHIDEALYAAVCPHVDARPNDKVHLQWMARTADPTAFKPRCRHEPDCCQ